MTKAFIRANRKVAIGETAYAVRDSQVHGLGAFAARPVRKGEVIDEYTGERITHEEANERYKHRDERDTLTFLFTVDEHTVIDGSVGGNGTRYINHRCEPNCAPRYRKGRVFIVATRDIAAGEELGFEYNIAREDDDPPDVDAIWACRCASPKCRGTLLWPPRLPVSNSRE